MRYRNPKSGLEIDLGDLEAEKKRFFETAQKQFRSNVSWFAFEQAVFSYTSPLFRRSRNRADVVHDPVFKALKDMWLQLGIDQGFVAPRPAPEHERTTETASRPPRADSTSYIRDMAPAREPRPPRRRGRKG